METTVERRALLWNIGAYFTILQGFTSKRFNLQTHHCQNHNYHIPLAYLTTVLQMHVFIMWQWMRWHCDKKWWWNWDLEGSGCCVFWSTGIFSGLVWRDLGKHSYDSQLNLLRFEWATPATHD